MNTLENLQNEYGIDPVNAEKMLKTYAMRVGTENGDYTITDVTYVGDGVRRVEETCRFCTTKIYRDLKNGRNKWSELQRFCDCQNENRRKEKEEARKAEKIKAKSSVLQKEVGNVYGEYEVVGHNSVDKLVVRCVECGAEKEISYSAMKSGRRRDYWCHAHRKSEPRNYEALIGEKKNRLTVMGVVRDPKSGKRRLLCKCDCGNERILIPALWEQGKVRSCGCYLENRVADADWTERIKGIYRGMRNRCLNPGNRDYKEYGGRGIQICEEWMDFEAFLRWSLENGYDNSKTIDRIDPNGNYCPENCRWADWYTQCVNRRPRRKNNAKTN